MIAALLPVPPRGKSPMPDSLPALSLVAVPGRRRLTLEVAREAERRGFSGLYVPSIFGNMAQSTALALATERVIFRHGDRADLCPNGRGFRPQRGLYPRGLGGRFRFGIASPMPRAICAWG